MTRARARRKTGRGAVLEVAKRPAKGELKKHASELGERYVFVDKGNMPAGKMYVVARVVRDVRKVYEPAAPRKHDVDAVMLFLGSGRGLVGLRAEVELGPERRSIESPSAVYVPAGVQHTYRILGGSGTYVKIVLAPGGDYNAVTT